MRYCKALAILLFLIPSVCYGADPNIYYVCVTPDGSNPGGYSKSHSTLTLAEAAIPANITNGGIGGGGTQYNIHIIGDWSGVTEAAQVYFSGTATGGTGSTTYIKASCPTAADMLTGATNSTRHSGILDLTKYKISVSNSANIRFGESNVRLDGIQIVPIVTPNNNGYGAYANATYLSQQITNCIIEGQVSGTGNAYGIYDISSGTYLIYNTLVYGFISGGDTGFNGINLNGVAEVYNSTVYNNFYNLVVTNASSIMKNVISFGSSDDFRNATGTIDYCASDDGDGLHAVVPDWAQTFTNYAAGNFSLLSGATVIGVGVDDPGGASQDNIDIAGNARSSTWDIGAFEYVAGGAPSPTKHKGTKASIIWSWLKEWLTPQAWARREE